MFRQPKVGILPDDACRVVSLAVAKKAQIRRRAAQRKYEPSFLETPEVGLDKGVATQAVVPRVYHQHGARRNQRKKFLVLKGGMPQRLISADRRGLIVVGDAGVR